MDPDIVLRFGSLLTWSAMIVFQRQPLWRLLRRTPRHLDPIWSLSALFACNRLIYVGGTLYRTPGRDMAATEVAGYLSAAILCTIWLIISDGYRRDDA